MDHTFITEQLTRAARCVEESAWHVVRQERVIDALRERGHDTTEARAGLDQFEALLELQTDMAKTWKALAESRRCFASTVNPCD